MTSKDNDGSLTLEEFLEAGGKMAELLKRQDAFEQNKKLNCLVFFGPSIQRQNNFSTEAMMELMERLLSSRMGVTVRRSDIGHVELKSVSSSESVFTKSIFVRFNDIDLR